VFPVRYELGFYIPEDDILHTQRRENLKSYNSVIHSETPLAIIAAYITVSDGRRERWHVVETKHARWLQ
jgi:hypothetical protein